MMPACTVKILKVLPLRTLCSPADSETFISGKSLLVLHLSCHRPREIGRAWLWGKLGKKARFEKPEKSSIVFQNDLAFLGRI